MKVLLDSFYLNCHTLEFHLQTWKLEPLCMAYQTVLIKGFHLIELSSLRMENFTPLTW